jgi:hypothetical protein
MFARAGFATRRMLAYRTGAPGYKPAASKQNV